MSPKAKSSGGGESERTAEPASVSRNAETPRADQASPRRAHDRHFKRKRGVPKRPRREPAILRHSGEPPPQPLLVTPRTACVLLAVGRTKLYRLIAQKKLESIMHGRARRLTMDSISRYCKPQH